MHETIKKYMAMPYTKIVQKQPDGSFFVTIKEFKGCMSEGDNLEEAMENIEDAMYCWIESMLEVGNPIPLPEED